MQQSLWLKIEEKIYSLIPPLALIYIFFQPFNHFAGARSISFSLMLLFFLSKITRKGIVVNWRDSTIVALFILLAAILFSIVFSNYVSDSLRAFRKNFLCQVVVFFVILTEFRSPEKLKSLLYAVVLSFITVTLIIFIKNPPATLFNILEAKADKETFLGGYALNAAFYIPFTLGYLFTIRNRLVVKGFFWVMLLSEFVLVWLYFSSRTTLLAIVVSGIAVILMSKRYKMLIIILVVFLGMIGISYLTKPELINRHKTLLSLETYRGNTDALNERHAIWRGAIDMIKDSPIVGYGYGWKKIALVVRARGYLEKWEEKWPATYNYFKKTNYGSANPHNLVLQLLFEVGIFGLTAFVVFWITLFIKIVRIAKSKIIRQETKELSELFYFVKYGVVGVLITYFMANITNGLWEETYGVLTFTLAAIVLVIYDKNRCKDY